MSAVDGPSGSRVLVIDDSEDQRELLRELFTRAGCVVTVADGTDDAAEMLARSPQDIVVVDLILEGLDDGWRAIERVRAITPTAAIVISSVLDVAEFPEADAFLPKPFTGAQVRALVEKLAS